MVTMPRARLRALLAILVVSMAAASGCQAPEPEARFETYLTRLGTALGVRAEPPLPRALPRPPRSGQLRLTLQGSSLDTLDFLALSGCAVQVTIGKRNSSLGRMARDSQRLLLALEYLRLAPACVQALGEQGRDTLAAQLHTAWEQKRDQLPQLLFNATLGSDEYRAFWRGTPVPRDYPAVGGAASRAALAAITDHARRWLGGDFTADNQGFEILLSEVAGGDGGILLSALARQADWLAAADAVVEARRARGPLCAPGVRHGAADVLPNVVRRYFIGDIQPPAAIMGRRYHEVLPPVRELESLLAGALPPLYVAWRDRRDALFTEVVAAPRRHAEQLQAIQAPCGPLAPAR